MDAGLDPRRLLPYLADLELEVDRLRRQSQFLQHEVAEHLARSRVPARDSAAALADLVRSAEQLAAAAADVGDDAGCHPAQDQVISVAVRPLVRRVFRRQQRLHRSPGVKLLLELGCDAVEWFPGRLHHILDNLMSSALRYHDGKQPDAWVHVCLREVDRWYELKVADNGPGLPADAQREATELFFRSAPARPAGFGTGLAVVKMLIEQSGGRFTLESSAGGTTLSAALPRYDLNDFLT